VGGAEQLIIEPWAFPRDPAAPTWTIEARREAYRADGYETDSRDYLEGK
jgi:hypothetical protein